MDLEFMKELGEALKGVDVDSPEEMEKALVAKVKDLGLDVDDLDIGWDMGTATVQGMAADQATLEKTLLAVGNTKGVLKVVDEMAVGLTSAEKGAMRKAAAEAAKETTEMADGRAAIAAQMDAARKRTAFRRQLDTYRKISEASRTTFYTVQKGDSLRRIAGKHYGDEAKWPEIFEANQPMIKKADLIYPGQVLRLPHLG